MLQNTSNDPGHQVTVMIRDASSSVNGRYRPLADEDFDLNRSADSIAADPRQYSTAPTNFTISSDATTIFVLDVGEKGFLQNLSTYPILVKKGDGCSPSSFSFGLKASTVIDDFTGGIVVFNDWIGPVSVSAPTNGSLRYIAWKMTT